MTALTGDGIQQDDWQKLTDLVIQYVEENNFIEGEKYRKKILNF